MSKNNKKESKKNYEALVVSNKALTARVTILENSVKNLGKASKVTAKYIKGNIKDSKAANVMKKTAATVAENQEASNKVVKRSKKFTKRVSDKARKIDSGIKKLDKIIKKLEDDDDESGGKKNKKSKKEKKKVIKKNNGETKEISATSAEILNTLSKAKM